MSRIKGITIEIDGDTKGLDKALSDVNKRSRDVQTELRQVDRLLKFNPGNTELIAQKQKLLGDQVQATRDKLTRLKDAQEQVTQAFERGEISEEQYRAFQREIIETESKLKHFESQLQQSQSSLKEFGDNMEKAGEKMKEVGEKMTSAGKDLTKKVTAPLMGIGAIAIKVGSDFEAGMSQVAAVSGASGDELEALTDKAREMGATTQFSASEAAEALNYMALAGWDTTQMLDGIDGVMALAAASGEDLGRVSDIVTDGLSAFGMAAEESARFADVLAAASANANTDVSGLGGAFEYVAPVAGALGFTIEDTALAIGLMSNAGIKGQKAGTALRTMMTNLAKPTAQMEKEMNKLGISLTDSEGNMKSFDDIMGDLRGSFSELDEAQQASAAATIFGKEAMSGALAIINASEDDYNKLAESINGAEGAAQDMADIMNDNLQGRLKEMKSALEEAAISIYDNLQPAMEKLVEFIKQLADWFNNLSPTIQNTIVVLSGVAAAIGPVLVVIGTLISSIGSIMTVVGPVIAAVGEMGGVIALLSNPIGIAIAAITAIVAALVLAYQNIEWFRDEVDAAWEWIKNATVVAFEAVKEVVTTVIQSAVDFAMEVLNKFKDFWDENGKAIMAIVKFHFDNIRSTIEMVMGIIKGIFEVVWPIISNTVKVAWETIKLAVSNALDIVLGVIDVAMKLLQGDWEGAWESIKKTAESIWKNIERFFTNINLYKIGQDIIQGLINGIGSMAQAVWDKVKEIANGIMSTITSVLGIASPSKVMIQFGKWTGEGLVIGLEAMFGQIKQVSKQMGEIILPNIPKPSDWNFGGGGGRGGSGSIDNSRNFNPHVVIHTNDSGSREMERTLRRLAFQFDA